MRTIQVCSLLACFGAATLLGNAAMAQDSRRIQLVDDPPHRHALVIGNASYANGPLVNPRHDSADMEALLRNLSFDVERIGDADLRTMEDAVKRLGGRLHPGDIGLFYYAGHGAQIDGISYLVPIGAHSGVDIRNQSMSLGFVLETLGASSNQLNLVILDACRDNPFIKFRSLARGLAETAAPTGTLIAYATAPGEVAVEGDRNGIFTKHLMESLGEPGLEFEEALKLARRGVADHTAGLQVPWTSSSLIGSVVLREPGPDEIMTSLEITPTEDALWEEIRDAADADELRRYLGRFPNGTFSKEARRIISERDLEGLPKADDDFLLKGMKCEFNALTKSPYGASNAADTLKRLKMIVMFK